MLGGEISVTSEPGVGTTFSVWFKTNVDEKAVTQEDEGQNAIDPMKHRLQTPSVAEERRHTVSTILVIDDDPNICNLVTRVLHKEGFNVVTASNGTAGLAMARKIKPKVITLDVMMPGMDGWATLRQLKSDSELKHIPVAMLTQLDERGLGFSLGADEYLFKPIDWDSLGNAIKKWVRKERHHPIMIVSNKPLLQEQLHAALGEQGYRITSAKTGKQAIPNLQQQPCSLILLELETNKTEIHDFIKQLRDNPSLKSIPVVAISATQLSEQEKEWLAKESVTSVLIEDIAEQQQLLQKIRALLGTNNSRHEAA